MGRRRRRMAARWYQGCFPGSIRFHQQQSQRRSSLTYLLTEFLLSLHQRRTWPSNESQKCTNSVFIFQQCLIFDFIFIGNTFMGHYKYLYVYIREAFKNKNDETYGIFHMLVDPPLPTYGKFFRDFFIV